MRWVLAATIVGVLACSEQDSASLSASASLVQKEGDAGPSSLPVAGAIAGAPAGAVILEANLEPARQMDLSFEVPGRVLQVLVREGDAVRRGQILAVLDTAEREKKLGETRQRWQSALASAPVSDDGSGRPPAYLAEEMEEHLERAREAARSNPEDLAAIRRAMLQEGQEAAADRAIAIAQVRTVKPDTATIRRNNRDSMSRALTHDLGQRVANLQDAVAKSRLVSPVDAVVQKVNAREGAEWQTRDPTPAVVLVDATAYRLRAPLAADRARALALGTGAWCELDGRGGPPQVVGCEVLAVSAEDIVLSGSGGAEATRWREVTFGLAGRLPVAVTVGDPVRIALSP